MLRRQLLIGTALTPFLASCAATTDATVQKIVTDVQAVLTGLTNLMPTLSPLIPASTEAQITLYLGYIKTALTAIQSAATAAAAQSPASQVTTYAMDLMSAITSLGIPLPASVKTAFSAVDVLLPLILSYVGLSMATAKAPTMTEAQALAVLTGQ